MRSSAAAGMGSDKLLPGMRRAIVLSDSPVMRAGVRALMPERSVQVVGELESWRRLDERVRATSTQLVVAAPVDGGDERLFHALARLPAGCGAIVLLAVPGFRIQAEAVARRFDVVCLPLNVGRDELHACIRGVLMSDEDGDVTVEELCAGPSPRTSPCTDERPARQRPAQGLRRRGRAATDMTFDIRAGELFGFVGQQRGRQDHHDADRPRRARRPTRARCAGTAVRRRRARRASATCPRSAGSIRR